jgi:hypothetical protein
MVCMQVAIVYESLFGNTHEVADAVAQGIRQAEPDAQVTCLRVEDATPEETVGADLLVVGGPTHMLGMSTSMSRSMGLHADRTELSEHTESGEPVLSAEPGAEGPGLRSWFHDLPKAAKGRQAAAFDTRAGTAMAGGAAHGIAHRLRRHGYEVVSEPRASSSSVPRGRSGPASTTGPGSGAQRSPAGRPPTPRSRRAGPEGLVVPGQDVGDSAWS